MKKQLFALLTALMLVISLCPAPAQAVSSAPSGYTAITTAQQLSDIRNNLSGKYILMNDIDVTSLTWSAIGYSSGGSTAFTGILDGNGYSVTGLDTTSHDPKTALIWTNSGTLRNLTITGTYKPYATISGVFCHYNTGRIENCHNKADVTHMKGTTSGTLYVGGITGKNTGTIQYCSNQATITSTVTKYSGSGSMTVYAGGIAGNNTGTIRECWNTGSILPTGSYADVYAGGIAGVCGNNAQFINCYNTGSVKASRSSSDSTSFSHNYGAGGILGSADSNTVTVTTCYNRGTISLNASYNNRYLGALIGWAGSNRTFINCYFLESGTMNATSSSVNATGTTKLTASQMRVQSNYTGFDFSSVWTMSTYPVLRIGCTHLTEYVAAKEPTCTADGNIAYYYCSICRMYFTSSGKSTQITKADTILPGGHSFTDRISDVLFSEATCTAGPVYYLQCDNCETVSDEYTLEAGAPLGHSYSEWVIMPEPTCTDSGIKRRDCKNCDHYEEETVAAQGHAYEDGFCTGCGEKDPSILPGDINCDGRIDLLDANLAAAYYGLNASLTKIQLLAADVNGDGSVNILDASLIAAFYNEIIDAFPA